MAKETFLLVPEEELNALVFQQQLEAGEITSEVFETLIPQEKEQVRNVLFNQYSVPVPTPAALSALEFTIFGLAKLFFRTQEGPELNEEEQAFYDRFKQYISEHEMELDPSGWYIPYAEKGMLEAKKNRAEYLAKKISITGSI